jgi:hypothetical protein
VPEHHHAAADGAAPPPLPGAGNGAVAPDAVLDPKRDPYAALVRAPGDLIAALAYVAYKHHEMEFIRAIESAGGTVSIEQLETFRIGCCVESQLGRYTTRAETLVRAFLDETLAKTEVELKDTFKSKETGLQLQAILDKFQERRSWSGWVADVVGNLSVQALTILLVAGLYFGFQALDAISGAAGRFVGVLHGEEAAHSQPPAGAAPGGAAIPQGSKQASRNGSR